MIDDYSPMYRGDTGTPWAIVVQYKNGTAYNLTGATFAMKMESVPFKNLKTCTGLWTIQDAVNGKASYSWQAADVSDVGNWNLYVSITIGGKTIHADPKSLTILPAP